MTTVGANGGHSMHGRILVCAIVFCLTGCMHIPLRSNTANQARTISDLYQQEVLNNLAMFVDDPNSLPHFSFAASGATGITDQGTVGVTPSWARASGGPLLFAGIGGAFTGQRTAVSNFVMTPVNDPRRLEMMRCAYQKVVAACCGSEAATQCPDCQTRFKIFYTGDPDGDINGLANGTVTSECIGHHCWFAVGCKKCVPKCCNNLLVGNYGKTYVWVLPGGRDELAKLTLAILDYAQNTPPSQIQKTVEYYLDERGLPTTFQRAVSKVTAQVGVKENNLSLLNQPPEDEAELRDSLEKEIDDLKAQIADAQDKNRTTTLDQLMPKLEILEAKKAYLDLQLKAGKLKEEYRQSVVPPSGAGGTLLLNQQINTLAPIQR